MGLGKKIRQSGEFQRELTPGCLFMYLWECPTTFLFKFAVFLFAVLAAVNLCLLVCQVEDMGKLLLNGCDAAGVLALNHIGDFLGKL